MATSVFHCFSPSKSSLALAQPLVLPFEDAHLPRGFFAENERPHRERLEGRDDRCGQSRQKTVIHRCVWCICLKTWENLVIGAF